MKLTSMLPLAGIVILAPHLPLEVARVIAWAIIGIGILLVLTPSN